MRDAVLYIEVYGLIRSVHMQEQQTLRRETGSNKATNKPGMLSNWEVAQGVCDQR